MNKLLLAILATIALSGCNGTHSYMDSAYVGVVDGSRTMVLRDAHPRNGVKMYRPQFDSDCPFSGRYVSDYTSTTCYIRESRVSQLQHYRDRTPVHVKKEQSISGAYIGTGVID